jgi:hypothetical protein
MDIFKSGSGISPAVAAAVDIGIAPKLGLQFKLGYEQKKWSNSGTKIADCRDLVDPFYVIPANVQSRYTVQANYLAIGAALRYDLTPQLWLTVGPVYHRLLGKVRQTERYEVDPNSNCGFLGPDKNLYRGSENLYRGLEIEAEIGPDDPVPAPPSGGRFGAELGIGYRIPLSPGLELVPRLSGQLLSSPRNGDVYTIDEWRKHTLDLLPVQWKGLSLYSVLLTVGVWFTIQ